MWISEFSISRGQLWPSGLCGWSNNCVMIWLKLQLTSAADAAGWLMLCVDLQLAGGEESSCPCEDYLSITHRHRCWGDLGGRGAQTEEKKVLSAKPHKSLRRCCGAAQGEVHCLNWLSVTPWKYKNITFHAGVLRVQGLIDVLSSCFIVKQGSFCTSIFFHL